MSIQFSSVNRNVTPKNATTLGCNGAIDQSYDKVDSPIEINALRLKQRGMDIIMISIDTLFVTDELKDHVLDHLNVTTNMSEHQLFMTASHTHYAPFLDRSKPKLGMVDNEYYDYFKHELLGLVDELMAKPCVAATIEYKELSTEGIAVGRRKIAWGFWKRVWPRKTMRLFPNPETFIDSKIRLFQFSDSNSGELLSIMWNFACHPVMHHSPNHLSAHFPGEIRLHLRHQWAENLPILFLQGFSGDVRPHNVGHSKSIKGRLLAYLNGVPEFQSFNQRTYKEWIEKLTKSVDTCLKSTGKVISEGSIKANKVKVPLHHLMTTDLQKSVSFQVVKLTADIIILGVSAEVVSSYFRLLQTKYPSKTVIPVGCVGEAFGYWPSQEMLNEKGYEVEGFQSLFSISGKFKPTLEDVFINSIHDTIK